VWSLLQVHFLIALTPSTSTPSSVCHHVRCCFSSFGWYGGSLSLSQPTHHGHCRLLISLSMYCSLVDPLGLCSRCPTNSYSRYASKQLDPSHSITFITNKPYWFSRLARSVCPVVRQSAFSTVAAATAHNAKSSGRLQAIGALGAAVLVVGMTSFKSMLQYQTTKPIVFDVSCKHNADSNNDKSNAIDS
jgi:hypothetical protein